MGLQAGTENSFSEISQTNSSVCWQLYEVEVPWRRTVSPHRPPVSILVGIQLSWEIIATRKPKESFAYGVCLQNNELLYYLRKDGSVVKNVTPPWLWGRKWQATVSGVENKRRVGIAYLFPPVTWSVAEESLTRSQTLPEVALKSEKRTSLSTLFPLLWLWARRTDLRFPPPGRLFMGSG